MPEHVQTVYGSNILESELAPLQPYVLVTMEMPWQVCKQRFSSIPPVHMAWVDSLDVDKLDAVYEGLPDHVNIVGLGGGTALDSAKYFAYRRQRQPLLIPSITSTNSPFTDFISIRKNGGSFGFKVDGYPKKIVVDYDLIRQANSRYNRAGYGDLLYIQTTLNDWWIAGADNAESPVDPAIESRLMSIMDSTFANAAEIGAGTDHGIRLLMEHTQESSGLYIDYPQYPISAGSEHLFAWNLELVTGKELIHGEMVSLGVVISSFLQRKYVTDSRYRELRQALDTAGVLYHPDEIGVSWDEIQRTLLTVEEYNQRVRKFHSVFGKTAWTPALFDELREYVFQRVEG
jgi:glycerol dehydrogenase-like iron-containing ADH family enzyme